MLLEKTSYPEASQPEVFFRIGVLKIFANFIGKHMCQIVFYEF